MILPHVTTSMQPNIHTHTQNTIAQRAVLGRENILRKHKGNRGVEERILGGG